jgi:hypothetical protein
MQNIFPATIVIAIIVIAGWLTWGSLNTSQHPSTQVATSTISTTTENTPVTYECDADAKICPDGSSVGRTGPRCEFSECPPLTAKSATIRTTMGQVMTGLSVSITPHKVIDDSRCPTDVQCIWAGTVKVKVTIKTPTETSDETLELGKPMQKGAYTITFTELTPSPHSGETIPDSSYRFVFVVEKK